MEGVHMFMIGLGAFAGLCGVLIAALRVRTLIAGRTATGIVVAVEEGSTARTGTKVRRMLAPVIEFDHDGRKIRFRSSLGLETALPVGSTVQVRNLVADPQTSAEVDSAPAFWIFPLGALLFAALFISIALWDAGYFAR